MMESVQILQHSYGAIYKSTLLENDSDDNPTFRK